MDEGLLPPIIAEIIARTTGFEKGIAEAKAEMDELAGAADAASADVAAGMDKAGESMDETGERAQALGADANATEADLANLGASAAVMAERTEEAGGRTSSAAEDMRDGVKGAAGDTADALGDVGVAAAALPAAMSDASDESAEAMKETEGDAEDHVTALDGLFAGMSTRLGGFGKSFGGLADDVRPALARIGEYTAAMGKQVTKVVEDLGVPIGDLEKKFDSLGAKAAGMREGAGAGAGASAAEGDAGAGAGAEGGVGAAPWLAAAAAVGFSIKEAVDLSDAEDKIRQFAGITAAAADQIIGAFQTTGGTVEYSSTQIADAYAGVVGQLQSMTGHALSAGQALGVMTASAKLAEATGDQLGDATSTLVGVMAAFQLKTGDAGNAANDLYEDSNAMGMSLGSTATTLERLRSKLGDTTGSLADMSTALMLWHDDGISGRAAVSSLTSGLTTMTSAQIASANATLQAHAVFEQLTPAAQRLATAYKNGTLSSQQLENATKKLPASQTAALSNFVSLTDKARETGGEFSKLGINVLNSKGQFIGLMPTVDLLREKFQGMTNQQKLSHLELIVGKSAAAAWLKVVDTAPGTIDKVSKALHKNTGLTKAARDATNSLGGEAHKTWAHFEDLAAEIGKDLVPALLDLLKVANWVIGALTTVTHVGEDIFSFAENSVTAKDPSLQRYLRMHHTVAPLPGGGTDAGTTNNRTNFESGSSSRGKGNGGGGLHIQNLVVHGNNMNEKQMVDELYWRLRPHLTQAVVK